MGCIRSPPCKHWRHNIQLLHLRFQAFNIVIVHLPRTAFAETSIGFGGVLRKNNHRIGGKAFEIARQQLLQPTAATNQTEQHKHAPEHPEAR